MHWQEYTHLDTSWHLLSRSPHHYSLSNSSNGQTKQDLAVQHRQHCMQVQAPQVSCPLWLWNMDPACWLWNMDPDFQNQVHEETSPHLLLGAEDQRLGAEQDQLPIVGPQEPLLATIKRQKLAWFGHVTSHDSLFQTIRQGTLEGGWCHGWQRKYWVDNIKEWTSLPMPELLTMASSRKQKRITAESSVVSPEPPSQSMDWTEWNKYLAD